MLLESHNLPVSCNYWHAAPVAGRAQNHISTCWLLHSSNVAVISFWVFLCHIFFSFPSVCQDSLW